MWLRALGDIRRGRVLAAAEVQEAHGAQYQLDRLKGTNILHENFIQNSSTWP